MSEHVGGDPGSDLLVNRIGSRLPKNVRGDLTEVDIGRKVFSAGSSQNNPELARKYQALRSEAGAALADLDRLIGTLEP